MMFSIAGYSLPNASVLLQHKGNVVVYHMDSLQTALRDAVDGDTLFLSKGEYPGFTIDKKITVRGEGQETIIAGRVIVDIPDSVTLESTLLEGLRILKYYDDTEHSGYSVRVMTPLNGFKIKQCFLNKMAFEKTMSDVIIDRCYISEDFILSKSTKSLRANNSRFYRVKFPSKSSKDIDFVNCNILSFSDFEYFRGAAINSITGYGRTGNYVTFDSASFINSLICTYRLTVDNSCYVENSWYYAINTKLVNDYSLSCIYTDEELLENGYIGNDGTVVGSNGGSTPYTLELAVPSVKASDVKLDAEKRVLNVKLTITAK